MSLGQTNTQKVALHREPAVARKVHYEKSGASEPQDLLSWSVGGTHLEEHASARWGLGAQHYRYCSQMAKVELEGKFSEGHSQDRA